MCVCMSVGMYVYVYVYNRVFLIDHAFTYRVEQTCVSMCMSVCMCMSVYVSVYNRVYLIDHAWTYRVEQARSLLENNEALLSRMSKLMEVDTSVDRLQANIVEDVLREMWK